VRVSRGARLRRVIVDRHNVIAPGDEIGFDRARDAERFHVSPGGVTVIPQGQVGYFARDIRGSGRRGYSE